MIIERNEKKVEVSTNVKRYQAGIAINAETFSILIDGIYEDKILAACREPLFNAVDAHTEAGCRDKPIIIHSPTDLEPWYSVKDGGIGMDFDMVTQTFMMLGSSTKRESNDLIGAKGIGSKAPFTVTDMFSVISVKDGTKTVYSVHKDQGIPEVVPLHESKTIEENGVEIKFNVDPTETEKYRRAIISCLRYAKFPYEINDPFVTSSIRDRTYPVQYTFKDEESGWMLEMYSSVSNNADSVVVMGQQPYKSKFLSNNPEWPLMMVSIPIGDCDVNPGREWTIEGKNDRGFEERLKAFVQTALDRRGEEIYHELRKLPKLADVLEYMKRVGGWFATKYGAKYIAELFRDYVDTVSVKGCVTYNGHGEKRRTDKDYSYADMMNGYHLVYNDDNKLVRSKCNQLFDVTGKAVYLTDNLGVAQMCDNPFFAGMIHKLSDLEKRPASKSDKKYGGYSLYEPGHPVWIIEQSGAIRKTRISRAEFDDIKYAMIYSGGQARGTCDLGSTAYLSTRHQPETFLSDLGIDDKLYIVPLNRVSWLDDDVRMITQDDLYKVASSNLLDYHLNQLTRQREYRSLLDDLKGIGVEVVKDPEYKEKVNMASTLYHVKGYYSAERTAKRIVNGRIRVGKSLINKVKERYPLLKHIPMEHFNSPEVAEYRKFIDSKGEK